MTAPYRRDENLRLGTNYHPAQLATHFAFPSYGGSFDAALDLCLACKRCKKDCPVNVDMATYKAEFLSHRYAGRLRPLAHYSMGWLPLWANLASRIPHVVYALT